MLRVYYKCFRSFVTKKHVAKYFPLRKHYSWDMSNIVNRSSIHKNTRSSRCFSMYKINQLFAINTGWNVCMIFRSAVLCWSLSSDLCDAVLSAEAWLPEILPLFQRSIHVRLPDRLHAPAHTFPRAVSVKIRNQCIVCLRCFVL